MQNDNDDIESLFRRAAESYPLNTSGGNWEKVAAKLDKESRRPGAAFYKSKMFLSSVLLLLAIGASITVYQYLKSSKQGPQENASNISTVPLAKNDNINDNKSDVINKGFNKVDNNIVSSNDKTIKRHGAIHPSNNPNKNNFESKPQNNNSALFKSTSRTHVFPLALKNSKTKGSLSQNIFVPEIFQDEHSINREDKNLTNASSTNSSSLPPVQQEKIKQTSDKENDEALKFEKPKEDTLRSADTTAKQLSKTRLKKYAKGIYASLIVGPDLSNIKSQAYDKLGLSAGILVGYNMNKLSVESGIFWDKKYYATDGKYFNPKINPSQPQYAKPLNLSGMCYMFEVPLNIGYSILQKNSNVIKIKTGLSSYFMKNESYDYSYMYYNQVAYGSSNYKNSSNTFFSQLNLSVNYLHNLSKKSAIGIEPYLKVPLKQIGFGRMNISSTGMYVVYLRKF